MSLEEEYQKHVKPILAAGFSLDPPGYERLSMWTHVLYQNHFASVEMATLIGMQIKLFDKANFHELVSVAEALYDKPSAYSESAADFRDKLNRFFHEKGIGWELSERDGIVFRGDETFAAATTEAAKVPQESGRSIAANEIHEALMNISRRPEPDRTGAIQHAMAALECTARDVTGDPNATLGALLPKLDLPKPLDTAVDKLWGFASNRARHLREGRNLDDLEAELVVSVACAVSAFLVKRIEQ